MRVSVVWSEDRWGEEGRVVATFSNHDAAVEWAREQTKRTHAEAEDRRELWFARLFFVVDMDLDNPDGKIATVSVGAPAVSDRVAKPGIDLSKVRKAVADGEPK